MTPGLLAVDDIRPILALLRQRRVRIDPMYAGECRRLFDNPGTRLNYMSRSGMLIDETAESLWSAGFTTRRLTCDETLALLETMFMPRARPAGRERAGKRAQILSAEERKARSNREKKFQCPECQQIARGARNTSILCGICYEIDGKIVPMARVEPTAEEVLRRMAASADEEKRKVA